MQEEDGSMQCKMVLQRFVMPFHNCCLSCLDLLNTQEMSEIRGITAQMQQNIYQQCFHTSTNSQQSESDSRRPDEKDPAGGQAEQPTEEAEAHPYADFSREELSGLLLERDSALAQCSSQVSYHTSEVMALPLKSFRLHAMQSDPGWLSCGTWMPLQPFFLHSFSTFIPGLLVSHLKQQASYVHFTAQLLELHSMGVSGMRWI